MDAMEGSGRVEMTPTEWLRLLPEDRPIGYGVLFLVDAAAENGLRRQSQERFEPYEGVYRAGWWGGYVSETVWELFWADYPAWCRDLYLLYRGGWNDYEPEAAPRLACLTPDLIVRTLSEWDGEPEYVYYTAADENGDV